MNNNILVSFISDTDIDKEKALIKDDGAFCKCVKKISSKKGDIKIYLIYNKDMLGNILSKDNIEDSQIEDSKKEFKNKIFEKVKEIRNDFKFENLIPKFDENNSYESDDVCKNIKEILKKIKDEKNIYFNCISGTFEMRLPLFIIGTYNKNITMLDNADIPSKEINKHENPGTKADDSSKQSSKKILEKNYDEIFYEIKTKYDKSNFVGKFIQKRNYKKEVKNYIVDLNKYADWFDEDYFKNNKKNFDEKFKIKNPPPPQHNNKKKQKSKNNQKASKQSN